MPIKTITLKLHRPGKRKSRIIDEAMLKYSRAYQYLLDKAYCDIASIRNKYVDNKGTYRSNNIAKWVDKEISRELNKFEVEPFKDSLRIDFAMTMSGYLNLGMVQQNVSFPVGFVSEEDWEHKYSLLTHQLINEHKSTDQYERVVKKLLRKYGSLRPVFFCRYAVNRDYCLLYDKKEDRYYAKLYLMNAKSADRKKIMPSEGKELHYVSRQKTILETGRKLERFLIIPLSFGKWQESYLKRALEEPGILKTARLIKKENEYYLSVNIDTGNVDKVKTCTYLGVSRALKSPVCYAITDAEGRIRHAGILNRGNINKSSVKSTSTDRLHIIANGIVAEALKHKSQVIAEDLSVRGDKLGWEEDERYVPVLNCQDYNKLIGILEYKLAGKGLPPPVRVSPVSIFYTCPQCGLHSKRNRFSEELFICTACGTTMDIDRLGSENLAVKLIKYSKSCIKVHIRNTTSGTRFINEVLGLDILISESPDWMEQLVNEIKNIIGEFYKAKDKYINDKGFKRRYSLIKKIESYNQIEKIIEII